MIDPRSDIASRSGGLRWPPAFTPRSHYGDVDNVAGAYLATSHLIRLGYERIATITGPLDSTTGIDRRAGYLKALRERGREVDERLIVEGDFSRDSGYTAMRQLLPLKPDAIFAASDSMAFGAIDALNEAGLARGRRGDHQVRRSAACHALIRR